MSPTERERTGVCRLRELVAAILVFLKGDPKGDKAPSSAGTCGYDA